MPFDFNGGNAPKKPNNSFKSDTNYTDNSTSSIPRPVSEERPTFSSGSSNSTGFSFASTQSPTKSSGFQNQPRRRTESDSNTGLTPSISQQTGYTPRKPGAKPPVVHRSGSGTNIPWKNVLPIIGLLTIIVFFWIFRYAITDFLMQLLTWLIITLIIIFIVKWFIFPRKK